jgi:hypothetical protein
VVALEIEKKEKIVQDILSRKKMTKLKVSLDMG